MVDGNGIRQEATATRATGKRTRRNGERHRPSDASTQAALQAALHRSQAVVELTLDGTILTANENFLRATGYTLDELLGQSHRMLVGGDDLDEERELWACLRRGEHRSGEFRRHGKDGRAVWFQAAYNAIAGPDGPFRVLLCATDVTSLKHQAVEATGCVAAIDRSLAVVELALDGTILRANESFLRLTGYALDEVQGRHHGSLLDEAGRGSAEYRELWSSLQRGEHPTGEFKRIGKDGREIWLQASYSPIFDLGGSPCKVLEVAADATAQVRRREQTSESAQSLAVSAEQMAAVSQQMSDNAEETFAQVRVVSAASDVVSGNIETAAAAIAEMSASIGEIARNAHQAARVATSAVHVAETTNATVAQLGESSAEVGKVIKIITSIAQQTNLLALNATIEAARAGEAGKGFAVVAHEVKELAKETAKATEHISQKVEAIQSITRRAVTAIAKISGIIGQINDIQTAIASAVEQQTATIHEVSRNIAEGARGSADITRSITAVATAANDTTAGAGKLLASAAQLSQMAMELEWLIG
jgi:methyl-accepting chemotaxis protein